MVKGYWVKQTSLATADLFAEYIQTLIPWLLSVGGKIIARDIKQESDLSEWDGGQLSIVVEFESKDIAQKAFESAVFQELIEIMGLEACLSLSIIG